MSSQQHLSSQEKIINKKHQWLLSQVDVDYPTPESILGRDIYTQRENSIAYEQIEISNIDSSDDMSLLDEVYLVDFHRLTVMFAQLQAKYWSDSRSQVSVLEFFAQITLSEEHKLYLGFKDRKAVICGIVTYGLPDEILISDIVSIEPDRELSSLFLHKVLEKQPDVSNIEHIISMKV